MMFNVDKFGFHGTFLWLLRRLVEWRKSFYEFYEMEKHLANRTFPAFLRTFVCDCFWLLASFASEVVKSLSVRWLLVNIRTTESYIAPASKFRGWLVPKCLLANWKGRSSLVINYGSSSDTPAATLKIKLWAHKMSEWDSIHDFKWLHELSMTISMAGTKSFVHKLRNNRFNRLNFHASWA